MKGSGTSGSKHGDDYAAHFCLFDLPPERLSLADRLAIAAARIGPVGAEANGGAVLRLGHGAGNPARSRPILIPTGCA